MVHAMKVLHALLLGLALAGCSKSEPSHDQQVTKATPSVKKDPAMAKELIGKGATVIDVRTADEYADEHLPNATNIPVQELPERLSDIAKLVGGDKTKPIVVYCAAGGRAGKAKRALDDAGYTHVINGGGLDDLRGQP